MKLYLGRLESSRLNETRVFGEIGGKLVDLAPAYAVLLCGKHDTGRAYELSAFYFPATIVEFLRRGESSLAALNDLVSFVQRTGLHYLDGLSGEKLLYEPGEVRLLPPLTGPEKTIVIGFADRARGETVPETELPAGFYKLPSTFTTFGGDIIWPKFSEELDCDACLAIVIGKAARRIQPAEAWDHVAGISLLLDITARDINKREGLTTNNLLGKNFPSSTSLGPALVLKPARSGLEALEIVLEVDGSVRQNFSVRECVFTIERIIAYWSILGLNPGDILAVGGSLALKNGALTNPIPLKLGSRIRCFSPAIGELSHRVVTSGEIQ